VFYDDYIIFLLDFLVLGHTWPCSTLRWVILFQQRWLC